MVIPLLMLFSLISAQLEQCTEANVAYHFGPCDDFTATRTAYFYWVKECQLGMQLPRPLHGLDCNLHCDPGEFLDLDPDKSISVCSKCPANTYSIGGGLRIDGIDVKWNDEFLANFNAFCSIWNQESNTFVKNTNCTTWTPSYDGDRISTGKASSNTLVHDQIIYTAHLIRPGIFTMKYSKDTKTIEKGVINGIFNVIINGHMYEDRDLIFDQWKYFNTTLKTGMNEIIIQYDRYNLEGFEDLNAEIEMLQIDGLSLNDHFCYPCTEGYSFAGSSEWAICPDNYFLDNFNNSPEILCLECPGGTYSYMGTVGIENCIHMKPCTEDDYYQTYTPCKDGVRTSEYEWISPKICTTHEGAIPPGREADLPCAPCPPGTISTPNGCFPCPSGMQNESDTSCTPWPAGTRAIKEKAWDTWVSDITPFENYCKTPEGKKCKTEWQARYDRLQSGNPGTADLTLKLLVEAIDPQAYIRFEFSLVNESGLSSFDFELNGQYHTYSENEESRSPQFSLIEGPNVVKWRYHNRGDADFATIHTIFVYGTTEGGASTWNQCPPGHFSSEGEETCTPCATGTMPGYLQNACIACEDQTFTDTAGQPEGCLPCPANTVASIDHTSCIGHDIISFNNYTVYINNLSGIAENKEGYYQGICLREANQLYWHQTYYGPISSEPGFFYVSVLNPSEFSLPGREFVDAMTKGFAFGVLKQDYLPVYNTTKTIEKCAQEGMTVNLGSRVESVSRTDAGFQISYDQGSLWGLNNADERFSTSLHFICDKSAEEGWPEFVNMANCTAQLEWRTKYACSICSASDVVRLESRCENNIQSVQIFEGDSWIILNNTLYSSYDLECSVTYELLNNSYVIWGIGAVCVIFVGVLIALVFYCKARRKFHRLRQYHGSYTATQQADDDPEDEAMRVGSK